MEPGMRRDLVGKGGNLLCRHNIGKYCAVNQPLQSETEMLMLLEGSISNVHWWHVKFLVLLPRSTLRFNISYITKLTAGQ